MYLSHCEIVEDFEAQIRKSGREPNDWLVGTAKDAGGPFFQQHRAIDLGDALAYREAYTTSAAESVVTHLVSDLGLTLDRESVPEPGKIVFIHRRVTSANDISTASLTAA